MEALVMLLNALNFCFYLFHCNWKGKYHIRRKIAVNTNIFLPVISFLIILIYQKLWSVRPYTLKICIYNHAFSDFRYWLNSNTLISSIAIITSQKSLFSYTFLCNLSFFCCCERMKAIQKIKITVVFISYSS